MIPATFVVATLAYLVVERPFMGHACPLSHPTESTPRRRLLLQVLTAQLGDAFLEERERGAPLGQRHVVGGMEEQRQAEPRATFAPSPVGFITRWVVDG